MIAINSVMTASLNSRERCRSHGEGEEEELDLEVDEKDEAMKELPWEINVSCDEEGVTE